MKGSAVSNVENTVIGPKTAVLPSGQEVTVTSPTITTPYQYLPTTSQQEFNQASQLSSIEEDLAQVEEIVEKFEVDSGLSLSVKGNLRANIEFWKSIGAPYFILSLIENGYKLPFASSPEPVKLRNNKSARFHANFVDQAIHELVLSGRVCVVAKKPLVVNPLSVSVQPCGKKRLILDLRHVNKCLLKQRVKLEDWKVALSYFTKGSYMFSFDLKSGYHHVEISQEHQTYLGFSWEVADSGDKIFYVFTVLPFGLSTAPYVFTKLLKPLVKRWRLQGICIAIFLDDGWGIVQDKQYCQATARAVRNHLSSAGFIANDEKSVWEPTQVLDWLGLTWNSIMGTLKIVDRRITKILKTIDHIINSNFKVSARSLASFTGQIISTGPVVSNIGRIMTRHCVMSTLCNDRWDTEFYLDDYCQEELYFWKTNLSNINNRHCFAYTCPSSFVYSDASAKGCGSVIGFNNEYVCHRMWTDSESLQSSTWRELRAIEFSLRSFAPVLKGSHVKWFTDSQSAARIVEVGSMKLDLHKIARRIFDICVQSGIYLDIQWIPRTLNQQADYISRLIDVDDWQTTSDLFSSLNERWGPHSVDCFANYYNHKLPRFFSRFWNPNTAGIDFFIQPLRGENC